MDTKLNAARPEYQDLLQKLLRLEKHVEEQKDYCVEMMACRKARGGTLAYGRYEKYLSRYSGFTIIGPEAHLEEISKISYPLGSLIGEIQTEKDFVIGAGKLDKNQQQRAKDRFCHEINEYLTQWPPFSYGKADMFSIVYLLRVALGRSEYIDTFIKADHFLPD